MDAVFETKVILKFKNLKRSDCDWNAEINWKKYYMYNVFKKFLKLTIEIHVYNYWNWEFSLFGVLQNLVC